VCSTRGGVLRADIAHLFVSRVFAAPHDTVSEIPYTLHPTPYTYTLHPTPYTQHPYNLLVFVSRVFAAPHDTVSEISYTLRPTPHPPHPTPCTLHPAPLQFARLCLSRFCCPS